MPAAFVILFFLCVQEDGDFPFLWAGEPVLDAIGDADRVLEGRDEGTGPMRCKTYEFLAEGSGSYTIELRSCFFDSYLVVETREGTLVGEEDGGLVGCHARLVVEIEEDQELLVRACALHGGLGEFQLLALVGAEPPLSGPALESAERQDARSCATLLAESLGPATRKLALALEETARSLHDRGNYNAARPLYERLLALREEVLGPRHPDIATTLSDLASVVADQGDVAAAIPLCERALAIREGVQGLRHPDTAVVLNNLANLLDAQGRNEDARVLYERALDIQEEVLGPGHPDTATLLNNLAWILTRQCDWEAAQTLYQRALDIKEKTLGPRHPETAVALGGLAAVLSARGELERARRLHEQALSIHEEVQGPRHPDTAGALGELAEVLVKQGDYEGARPLCERSLAIREEVLGPRHPETAMALLGLADVLRAQGNLGTARTLYERALAIREEVLGPRHRDTALALDSLANVLREQGNLDEALPRYERALAIREEVLGPRHRGTAAAANNLALLLYTQGKLEAARPLFERAVAIAKEALGPRHPDTAIMLNNLGLLSAGMGEHDAARVLYEQALSIEEEVLGQGHPETTRTLHNLARLSFLQGDMQSALAAQMRTLESRRTLLRQLAVLSERERFLWMARQRGDFEQLLSWTRGRADLSPPERIYGSVLDFKGMISRGLLQTREFLQKSMDPEVRKLEADLHATLEELSSLFFSSDWQPSEQRERRAEVLRERRDALERELSRVVASSSAGDPVNQVRLLRDRLSDSEALLDFVFFRGQSVEELSVFVVRRQGVQRVDFGPAEPILRALRSGNGAGTGVRGGSLAQAPPGQGSVRALLWEPALPFLQGCTRIFVCPDGPLATLSFDALPGRTHGSYLIEEYEFVYLQSAQDLLRTFEVPPGTGALIAGGIDYDQPGTVTAVPGSGSAPSLAQGSGDVRGMAGNWPPLRGTLEEARELAFDYAGSHAGESAVVLLGRDASEHAVKEHIAGKRYVHIATHGFFASAGVVSLWDAARQSTSDEEGMPSLVGRRGEKLSGWLPGLLSGIVLSGANAAGKDSSSDGILTAEEAAWLDLSACDLVTLSACQTGLGTPQAGEQLIGLRRALRMAGARTTVTSLWAVSDSATRELMQDFYQGLWRKGQGKLEALRGAQLAMLARNRALRGEGLPETWGAFVLEGDWR